MECRKIEKKSIRDLVYKYCYIIIAAMILMLAILMWNIFQNTNKCIEMSIVYSPYGTTQNETSIEYIFDGVKIQKNSEVINFQTSFEIENFENVYDFTLRPGDQSGTVLIEKIVFSNAINTVELYPEEILDFFEINNAYSVELQEDCLRLYTFDISLVELILSDEGKQAINKLQESMIKDIFFLTVFLCCILICLVEKQWSYLLDSTIRLSKFLEKFIPFLFALCVIAIYLSGAEDMLGSGGDANDIWKTITTYYSEETYISYVLYKGLFAVYPYVWLYQLSLLMGVGNFFFIKIFHILLLAYILGIGFPCIFEYLFNKKFSIGKKVVYISLIFLLQVDNGAYTTIMIDLPYLFWFTLLIHMYVAIKSKPFKHVYIKYVLFGVATGCCMCFTGQYKFSAVMACILILFEVLKKLNQKNGCQRLCKMLLLFVMMGSVMISENLFQTQVVENFRKEDVWLPTASSLVQYQFSKSEPNAVYGYRGIAIKDYQIMAIAEVESPKYEELSSTAEILKEYLRVGLEHPGEFIVSFANKFFMVFACDGGNYVLSYYLLSYSLVFLGIWVIYQQRDAFKRHVPIFVLFLLTIIAPCATHVEARYVMAIQNFMFGLALFGNELGKEFKIAGARLKSKISSKPEESVKRNQWTLWISFIYFCFILMCIMHLSNLGMMNWLAKGKIYLFQ